MEWSLSAAEAISRCLAVARPFAARAKAVAVEPSPETAGLRRKDTWGAGRKLARRRMAGVLLLLSGGIKPFALDGLMS